MSKKLIGFSRKSNARVTEHNLMSNPVQVRTEIDFAVADLERFYVLTGADELGEPDIRAGERGHAILARQDLPNHALKLARKAGGIEWTVPAMRNVHRPNDDPNEARISFRLERLAVFDALIRADATELWDQLSPDRKTGTDAGRSVDHLDALAGQDSSQLQTPDAASHAVSALRAQIIQALKADRQSGDYDVQSGLFGPKFSALVTSFAESRTSLTSLVQCLEIIAVGDSKSPVHDAAEALIECGHWSAVPDDLQPDMTRLKTQPPRG